MKYKFILFLPGYLKAQLLRALVPSYLHGLRSPNPARSHCKLENSVVRTPLEMYKGVGAGFHG